MEQRKVSGACDERSCQVCCCVQEGGHHATRSCVLHMVQIWSKHICLYSAGIFLLCSSENPLFFLPVNASAVVDSEFRLTKFSFFEQQQISEFLLPRLVLRVVLVFPLAHCMFLCPIFLQEGCVFFSWIKFTGSVSNISSTGFIFFFIHILLPQSRL